MNQLLIFKTHFDINLSANDIVSYFKLILKHINYDI